MLRFNPFALVYFLLACPQALVFLVKRQDKPCIVKIYPASCVQIDFYDPWIIRRNGLS